VIEPRPIVFGEDWSELDPDGVPLVKSVLRAFVGRCQSCGCEAEAHRGGSVLINLVTVDGTLYGDTLCAACVTGDLEGPLIYLPPLPRFDDADEKGD